MEPNKLENLLHSGGMRLTQIKNICKELVKSALPIGGGLILSDIFFKTKFGVLDRLLVAADKASGAVIDIVDQAIKAKHVAVVIVIIIGLIIFLKKKKNA